MAFSVRIYGHSGLTRMKVLGASQYSSDSVYQLQQPYLWNQTLSTNGSTPVSSTAAPTPAGMTIDPTDVLRIEVPDGQAIRYEVNPPGRSVAASNDSPILTGKDVLKWGANFTLSIIEATPTS